MSLANQGYAPILMYHKVDSPPSNTITRPHYLEPERFRRHLRLLKLLSFRTVTMKSLFEEPLWRRLAVLTFDDGYRNFYTNALPALVEAGMTGTVFVVSSLVGGQNEWDTVRGDIPSDLMDADELAGCHHRGIEIGSHTCTHADLSAIEDAGARHELIQSKRELESRLKTEIHSFCYPYGRKALQTEMLVREAGYSFACGIEAGYNTPQTNRYYLRRINVRRDTGVALLLYKLLRDRRRV